MNQNPPLTPEEAKNLNFPCLLEVWDCTNRTGRYAIITRVAGNGRFVNVNRTQWGYAALPSAEITEAMRKQFGTQSEYPKRMLVWGDDESKAQPRIVIGYLGEKYRHPYITVLKGDEDAYENGRGFGAISHTNAKPIPEPDPIAQEIAELRQRLADLEAKHNQQSK